MAKRRGSGEGSVYEHTTVDGTGRKMTRWRGSIDLGWQDGKRKRKTVSGRTRQEALQRMRAEQRRLETGVVADGKMTVEKWLTHWLDTVVAGRVGSELTLANYAQVVRLHLVPTLGKVKLDKLTPEQVDRLLADKAAEGLSRSYITRMRTILADALRHAEKRGLVPRNAGELSDMPATALRTPRRSLTPTEARALLQAADGERIRALVVVGLATGLRPGELSGLLWDDLDLESAPPTLTVSGSLKRRSDGTTYRGAVKRSTAGQRTIALPPMAAEALRRHKGAQAAERLKAGSAWHDHGLVFSSEVGSAIDGSNMRRTFARIAKRAELPEGFPYMLRHTAVSLLIDAGASIEEVADLLGDDPRTLYRHYRHKVRPVAEAATRMETVLSQA